MLHSIINIYSMFRLLPALLFFALMSCTPEQLRPLGEGELRLRFTDSTIPELRARNEIIDTNEFLLTITAENGEKIYDDTYGNAPEVLHLPSGTYTVRAVSGEFKKPMFAAPQYGDEQVVLIRSGEAQQVHLLCSQLNAGVQLKIASNFLTAYPQSALVLRHADGSLLYSYRERRIAYFRPGNLQLILTTGAQDKVLLTRKLRANDILHLSLSASGPGPEPESPSHPDPEEEGLSMRLDTVHHWTYEKFVIRGNGGDESPRPDSGDGEDGDHADGGGFNPEGDGETADQGAGGGSGNSAWDAYTIAQAIRHPGSQDVWVRGYIVAGDLTTATENYRPPFKSKSNLMLAPRAGKCERSSCLAVSLPEGEVREALNLVDNPDLIGKQVSICGDVVDKYFKISGLKNVSAYEL